MTESPNFDAPPTAALWDREMERIVGTLRPGRNVQDFGAWKDEIRRQYGHHPYGRLRRAVSLLLTQSDEVPTPLVFGMWMREAETQLAKEQRLDQGLLPVDESRREREEREKYETAYKNVGPGTEAMEWGICAGIAKQRKRQKLVKENPEINTDNFRSPQEKEDFGPGPDEPDELETRDVYDERRAAGVPIGRNPTATSRTGGLRHITESFATRDPARFLKAGGGWKSSRDILEERRREGRLEPTMEQYLLEKIAEEEADGGSAA